MHNVVAGVKGLRWFAQRALVGALHTSLLSRAVLGNGARHGKRTAAPLLLLLLVVVVVGVSIVVVLG